MKNNLNCAQLIENKHSTLRQGDNFFAFFADEKRCGLAGLGLASRRHRMRILLARQVSGRTQALFRYPAMWSDSDTHALGYRFRPWLSGLLAVIACIFLAPAHAKKAPPPFHSVDLNTATEKQLEQLPGVGPTTAKAIIEFRAKAGRFHRVEDLLVIRGISETKLKKIRPYVTIAPPPKKTAQTPSHSPRE